MNAALDEKVRERLRTITGGSPKKSPTDDLKYRRYFLSVWFSSGWWCGLGFSLPTTMSEYPALTLQLEIAPNTRPDPKHALIEALRQVAKQPQWVAYHLDASREWSGIYQSRSLKDVLAHDDHVAAIKCIFFEFLDQLSTIRAQFPHLPWGTGQETVSQQKDASGAPS